MSQIANIADVYRGGWEDADDLNPMLGDIIDFNRGTYMHHGIYVGNGKVVHKLGKDASWTSSTIELKRLKSVANGNKVRVNNHEPGALARGLSARSSQDIVDAAMKAVGDEEGYSVYEQNCEEFVTRMRYGTGWSSQAGVAATLALPSSGAVSASLGSYAAYQSLPQGQ